MTHFTTTILMAALLSAATALIHRGPKPLYAALRTFATSITAVIALAWLMFFIH